LALAAGLQTGSFPVHHSPRNNCDRRIESVGPELLGEHVIDLSRSARQDFSLAGGDLSSDLSSRNTSMQLFFSLHI
jgi:hypothetical protein